MEKMKKKKTQKTMIAAVVAKHRSKTINFRTWKSGHI